jgi:hypothetical protein
MPPTKKPRDRDTYYIKKDFASIHPLAVRVHGIANFFVPACVPVCVPAADSS